jgi:plastocyanin
LGPKLEICLDIIIKKGTCYLPKMISRRVLNIFVVAAIAASFSLAVATSLFATFPSGQQQQAIAQQDNATAATTTSTTNQTMAPASTNKTFYLFNTELEGLDEATAGIPHYIYSLPVIVANRGDSVTVNFFNIAETEEETEEEEEEATEEEGRHSFTINTPPYSVDIDTAAGESGNATFTADEEGVFQYYCKYHPPTMRGQLVVLPSSSPGGSPPAT